MKTDLPPVVSNALEKFKERFGFELCPTGMPVGQTLCYTPSRGDLTCCYLSSVPLTDDCQPPTREEMQRWLLEMGVLLQEYPTRYGTNYLLAPLNDLKVSTAYHATARKNLKAIKSEGLLPGDSSKGRASTSQRFDCEGNILVYDKLGEPQDVGQICTYSAHWWRDELAKASGDSEYVILELVKLDTLPGLKATRDFASDSGIKLLGVDRIPPEHIRVVWPTVETEVDSPK